MDKINYKWNLVQLIHPGKLRKKEEILVVGIENKNINNNSKKLSFTNWLLTIKEKLALLF